MSAISLQNSTSRRGGWPAHGESTTASNVGTGVGVYRNQSGSNLVFKSLVSAGSITITPGTDVITISSSGESNTASNAGSGVGIFKGKVVADLVFKSLVAGTNISLTPGTNTITIDSSGEANTASNAGSEVGIFKGKVLQDLVFKSLKAGTGITLTPDTDTISIDSSGEANTASNLDSGTGKYGWFVSKVGTNLGFRALSVGGTLSLSATATLITITSNAEVNTASNAGGEVGIFKGKVLQDLVFKSLKAGTNITLTPGTDTITIDASGGLPSGTDNYFPYWSSGTLTSTSTLINSSGDIILRKASSGAGSFTSFTIDNTTTTRSARLILSNSTDAKSCSISYYPSNDSLFVTAAGANITVDGTYFQFYRMTAATDLTVLLQNGTTGQTEKIVFSNAADGLTGTIELQSNGILQHSASGICLKENTFNSVLYINAAGFSYTGGDAVFTRTDTHDTHVVIDNGTTGKACTIFFQNSGNNKSASIEFKNNGLSIVATATLTIGSLSLLPIVSILGGSVSLSNSNSSFGISGSTWTFLDGEVVIGRSLLSGSNTTLTIESQTTGKNAVIYLNNSNSLQSLTITTGLYSGITANTNLNIDGGSNLVLKGSQLVREQVGTMYSEVGTSSFKLNYTNDVFVVDNLGTIYTGPISTDGTHRLITTAGELNIEKRVSGSYVSDVGTYQAIASGTSYTLTSTYAAVTFGTTSPAITIARPGTYLVMIRGGVKTSGANVTASGWGHWFKIRRTNNTVADISESFASVPAIELDDGWSTVFGMLCAPAIYTTTNTDDNLAVYAKNSSNPTSGSFVVYTCSITAVRLR
jgi:hypothetical protein